MSKVYSSQVRKKQPSIEIDLFCRSRRAQKLDTLCVRQTEVASRKINAKCRKRRANRFKLTKGAETTRRDKKLETGTTKGDRDIERERKRTNEEKDERRAGFFDARASFPSLVRAGWVNQS